MLNNDQFLDYIKMRAYVPTIGAQWAKEFVQVQVFTVTEHFYRARNTMTKAVAEYRALRQWMPEQNPRVLWKSAYRMVRREGV